MARRKSLTPDYEPVKDILIPYRRVSTREQADSGLGLAAQETAITAALTYRQQTAYGWQFVDKGKSGKNLNRRGLEDALAVVRSGAAGGIVVSKLDRLSRSLLDFATLMAQADAEGWNIVALDLNVDLTTPGGKMMAGVLAVFAQFERDVIGQRTRDALAEKRADGVRLGRRRTISDELLQAIIGMYLLEGMNCSAVARWLNEVGVPLPHGGKQWHPASVRALVNSQDGRVLLGRWEDAA